MNSQNLEQRLALLERRVRLHEQMRADPHTGMVVSWNNGVPTINLQSAVQIPVAVTGWTSGCGTYAWREEVYNLSGQRIMSGALFGGSGAFSGSNLMVEMNGNVITSGNFPIHTRAWRRAYTPNSADVWEFQWQSGGTGVSVVSGAAALNIVDTSGVRTSGILTLITPLAAVRSGQFGEGIIWNPVAASSGTGGIVTASGTFEAYPQTFDGVKNFNGQVGVNVVGLTEASVAGDGYARPFYVVASDISGRGVETVIDISTFLNPPDVSGEITSFSEIDLLKNSPLVGNVYAPGTLRVYGTAGFVDQIRIGHADPDSLQLLINNPSSTWSGTGANYPHLFANGVQLFFDPDNYALVLDQSSTDASQTVGPRYCISRGFNASGPLSTVYGQGGISDPLTGGQGWLLRPGARCYGGIINNTGYGTTVAGYVPYAGMDGTAWGSGTTIGFHPPAWSNSSGQKGAVALDSQYWYVCVDANQWRRVALTSGTSGGW